MLGRLIDQHGANVWLVNTGWTGGAYGVGSRMKLSHTRQMVNALLSGELAKAKTETDALFGLATPTEIPGVPKNVLRPRDTWKDQTAYDAQAKKLAGMFRENFTKFESFVSDAVRNAGPRA
jgi:phosphoenolpyruvate carboxykinase (ATP)